MGELLHAPMNPAPEPSPPRPVGDSLGSKATGVLIRPLRESDLPEARRIFHLAFGTFLGLPDPTQFLPDREFVATRWRTEASGAFAAEQDGQLLGSNFATRWGSVGHFGPLSVHPDAWDRGVARRLLEATMDRFDQWQTQHAGLFTFPHSAKHIHLYQKFGFWPRYLTLVMSLAVRPIVAAELQTYSGLSPEQREDFLKAAHELTDSIYEGLDLRHEIRSVATQALGDTVLLWDEARLAAFAVCHGGVGTEAGDGACYVKFAAARSADDFGNLLAACEAFAQGQQLRRVEAGVNLAREEAFRRMMAHGFRTHHIGVAMHRANDQGYSRPDALVIDDWR
jgi:GNAT superfamily N-acetyltransferase